MKVEEVKGKMHVCNSHLESPIDQVVVPTGLKTTAAEIVAEALIKFDLVVSAYYCPFFLLVKHLAMLTCAFLSLQLSTVTNFLYTVCVCVCVCVYSCRSCCTCNK